MNSEMPPRSGGEIREEGTPLITTPAVEAQRAESSLHSETRVPHLPLEGAGGTFAWGAYFQAIGILIALLVLFWFVLRLIRKVGAGRFLPETPAAQSAEVCSSTRRNSETLHSS